MKFVANVEICNRVAATFGMPKNRSQRSTLSLGTKPGNPNELILVHQSVQNSMGTVYKVKGNIERIFDKCARDGKTTIRFREPPHDLLINGEASNINKFVQALKMALGKNTPVKCLKLPVVVGQPMKKIPPKPKLHLNYLTNSEYPILEGFPKSAVTIKINGLNKSRFDMRLLSLVNLKVLDLTDNKISLIPPEVDLLPSLQVLSLANNCLGREKMKAWTWLQGERLRRQLEELDLSGNEIYYLPPAVCYLRLLHTLKIKNNKLKILPGAIGLLKHLKTLVASENQLEYFPGSTTMLRLWHLDVTNNNFSLRPREPVQMQLQIPSLMEWAARSVFNNRLFVGPDDLPKEVQGYLNTASFCHCRQFCFESSLPIFNMVPLNSIAENIVRLIDDVPEVPVKFHLCSHQCAAVYNSSFEV